MICMLKIRKFHLLLPLNAIVIESKQDQRKEEAKATVVIKKQQNSVQDDVTTGGHRKVKSNFKTARARIKRTGIGQAVEILGLEIAQLSSHGL